MNTWITYWYTERSYVHESWSLYLWHWMVTCLSLLLSEWNVRSYTAYALSETWSYAFINECYKYLYFVLLQMYHWQSSLCSTASESPQHLNTTKKILQLMAVGQFIPPPLDGVSEIIHILHPFHLHCILVDIWNYVRDNPPTPGRYLTTKNNIV